MFLDLECFDLEQGQNYHRGDFLLLKSVRYTPIAFLPNPCSMRVIATERETFEDEKTSMSYVRKSMSYVRKTMLYIGRCGYIVPLFYCHKLQISTFKRCVSRKGFNKVVRLCHLVLQ